MKKKIYLKIIIILLLLLLLIPIFKGEKVHATPKKKNVTSTVFVDIKGAVKKPGVYEVNSNSRIIDVIKKAGDLKKDADTSIINLSKKVKDEMYIIIYTKDQIKEYKEKFNSSSKVVEEIEEKIICPDTDNDACINTESSDIKGKININNASLKELSSLTGIGETKAKKIIEYRNKNKFEKIEDIKNVTGIGDSLYEKIKDDIEV